MNPYTKKYLEFLETNDNENTKFTEVNSMPKFLYEVYALEEITKNNVKWISRDKLDKNEYLNTALGHTAQIIHNEKLKRKEDNKPFWFITISPKPEADFNEFKSAIEDVSTFCWVEKCYWTFEQRGATLEKMGTGFHAHIILEKYNIAPSKLKSIMKNKFSKFIVVDKFIDNKINILEKKKPFLQDKLDYIMGKKIDSDKPEKCEIDKKWREKLQMELFYSFDILTDERRISNSLGGRREGSGVKKGTKRGNYKGKKNITKNSNKNDINEINEITFVKKKNVLTF